MLSLVGLFAPLPTPLTDDGSTISEVRLARTIRWLTQQGIAGFIVGTETGQSTSLSLSERKLLLEIAMREAQGRPVLSNVTAFSTTAALDLAQSAHRHGVRAVVLAPPPFAVLTEAELYHHYSTIAQHAGTHVIAIDPQGVFTPALIQRLENLPMFVQAQPIQGHCCIYPTGTHTDSFSFGDMVVSPMAAIAPWLLTPHMANCTLQPELAATGSRRLVSAALELHGIEVGPLRGPYLSLNTALTDLLRTFLEQSRSQAA